ncbi:ubiquinol-cytochrome-c reductase complex core protein 2 [Ophiocordyceps camponoti-floridani]|uniref:Cytochrome b-c1 complex subunit 2, mitochondrial n=1 Tax=Ophiocordyceps camponoti-floridani TaxID=2030778 RepID=A0A8H4VAX6_9HYPO|nr:ubiquinol-cytochrome-c reductase complex core protein 2 [Ophiocordyceps camponoti-floridani]
MISRHSLARPAQHAARLSCSANPLRRRGFAAAASTGAFQTDEVSGLRVASRDAHGPTAKLAIIAKAGTRYQPLPGLTVGLEEFAFKTTQRRSALRVQRESELLGGQLAASHTREVLLLEASFLREDLPFFAELLAEVVSMTKYTTHELHEDVQRVLPYKQAAVQASAPSLALDNAHAVAFHTGLGAPIYLSSAAPYNKYLNEEYIASYADLVYSKTNFAVVADGTSPSNLSKWIGQFFADVPASSQSGQTLKIEASKYHGGEQRIDHDSRENSMVIAFPGSDMTGSKPEIPVLASLLGGKPTIKWTHGFSLLSKDCAALPNLSVSASNLAYSDAGLLAVQMSGPASSVRKAALATAKALKSVAEGSVKKEDVSRAIANAKFEALDKAQLRDPSMLLAGSGIVTRGKPSDVTEVVRSFDSVTADKVISTAKALLSGKATVSTAGDLFILPFADELALKV